MRRPFAAVPFLLATMLPACAAVGDFVTSPLRPLLPQSLGDQNSGYVYIPIDPLAVLATGQECQNELSALPDNAVRISIASADSTGKLSFGTNNIGVRGNSYSVVLDYINTDTSNVAFMFLYSRASDNSIERFQAVRITAEMQADLTDNLCWLASSGDSYRWPPEAGWPVTGPGIPYDHCDPVVIPVYIGVGLRLTSQVRVLRGDVNLSSLSGIAASVDAGRSTGSLVVQTLGITGAEIATTLPLPNEINQNTVEAAILSLAVIKSKLYDTDGRVIIRPRVAGIHLPFNDGSEEIVNAIVSELARAPIPWERHCPSATSPPATAAQ